MEDIEIIRTAAKRLIEDYDNIEILELKDKDAGVKVLREMLDFVRGLSKWY